MAVIKVRRRVYHADVRHELSIDAPQEPIWCTATNSATGEECTGARDHRGPHLASRGVGDVGRWWPNERVWVV